MNPVSIDVAVSGAPVSVALHVAYLCGNFGAAHELLQQGASASARDLHHRTPMQMLQQHRTARSRPLSGSAATTSHGRSGSGHKAAVTSPSVSARRDRPFAGTTTSFILAMPGE